MYLMIHNAKKEKKNKKDSRFDNYELNYAITNKF